MQQLYVVTSESIVFAILGGGLNFCIFLVINE